MLKLGVVLKLIIKFKCGKNKQKLKHHIAMRYPTIHLFSVKQFQATVFSDTYSFTVLCYICLMFCKCPMAVNCGKMDVF